MSGDRIIWFGRYEGWLRWLCHGVKDKDAECLRKAALLFDMMLPDTEETVVVPMPAHTGKADAMLMVMFMMRAWSPRRWYAPIIECDPHEPCYEQKKQGHSPSAFKMRLVGGARVPEGKRIFVIDNVVASGATAAAALAALPGARVCTLAKS